jgi:hypothetical protein
MESCGKLPLWVAALRHARDRDPALPIRNQDLHRARSTPVQGRSRRQRRSLTDASFIRRIWIAAEKHPPK